jgi:hypothetical protein
MCPGQTITKWTLSRLCCRYVLEWGSRRMHKCFCALRKVQDEAIPTVPPERQTEGWKALKLGGKAAYIPKWAKRSQESIWEMGKESE